VPLKIVADLHEWGVAFAMGAGIGFLYFCGLWWTVRRLPSVKRTGLFLLLSFFLRTGLALALFYLVMGGKWERLLAGVLGFMLTRVLLVRRLRPVSTNISTD
jgi:F1F0 ATPase subunit 2